MSITQRYAAVFRIVKQPASKSLTSAFKSPGRSKKHPMEQRMSRDFNNLDYCIHQKDNFVNNIKKSYNRSPKIRPKSPHLKDKNNPEIITFKIPNNVLQLNRSQSLQGVSPNNYSRTQNLQKNSLLEQTNNSFGLSKGLKSTCSGFFKNQIETDNYGLSPFENSQTIIGKIQSKKSHHLNFGKKPERPQNINKVWYSKNQAFSLIDASKNAVMQKIHPFKSYRPHNSFAPAQNLDKVYDDTKGLLKTKIRPDISLRKLQGYNKRPDIPKRQGTQLNYQIDRSLLDKKRPIFEISKSERKLRISKQVISPERGCYR